MAITDYQIELKFGASNWVTLGNGNNIVITRGTNRVMDDYQAGTLQVTFTNNDRTYDPTNTGSSLWYGAGGYSLVQPGAQVRVTVNTTIVFYGWVQDWEFTFDNAGFDANAVMTAGDLMYYMSRINYTGSTDALGGLTGDVIGNTLYSYGLPVTQVIGRNAKTVIGLNTHNSGDNVLSFIQNVARSEPGDLYAVRGSSATMAFKDRTFTDYYWTASYRQNLIKYPSANTLDTTDYINGNGLGNGWISRWLGSTAVYGYGHTVSNASEARPITSDNYLEYVEVNPQKYNSSYLTGQSFVFSAQFKGNALPAGLTGSLALLDASGNIINNGGGSALVMSATAVSNAVWGSMAGTVTANATAQVAGMSITVTAAGTTSASSFVGDAWYFEDASTADGLYWDGSYTPLSSTTGVKRSYAWLGLPYQSSSVLAINTADATAYPPPMLTFADANSQGASYGNGTALPFVSLNLASSGLNLYNQTQIVGVNGTGTATDTAGSALYGLKTYSQTDNLTTSFTRPQEIAQDVLGMWRLPEYRATEFVVALEGLTTAQQNLVLSLELRDVIRLCFQPSAQGAIIDKYYQILSMNTSADAERNHVAFQVASLSNVPVRLDSRFVAVLDSCVLG